MVRRIERQENRYRVLTGQTSDYVADAVIFAAPTFLAPYIDRGLAALRSSSTRPG